MSENKAPSFSTNLYDRDGDIYSDGIYLHYGDTMIKICEDIKGFNEYIEHLIVMKKEINEAFNNY